MALFDDAFKYGVAKQMMDTVKNTVNTTINEGFTAGGRVLRNAYQGSEVNRLRGVLKGAIKKSDDGFNDAARKYMKQNKDTIVDGLNKIDPSVGKKKIKKDIASGGLDNMTVKDLQNSYNDATKYMKEQGHMTTGGKAGLAGAAYIGGTKILREDNDAPLVPFL